VKCPSSQSSGPCGPFSTAPLACGLCWLSLSFLLVGAAMALSTIAAGLLAKEGMRWLLLRLLRVHRNRRERSLCKMPKSSTMALRSGSAFATSTGTAKSGSSSTFLLIALFAVLLPLVSGCSTTPSATPQPLPPIPGANLVRCPDLPYRIREGVPAEAFAALIAVAGRYYECQSMMDDLIRIVRNRQKIVDNP